MKKDFDSRILPKSSAALIDFGLLIARAF